MSYEKKSSTFQKHQLLAEMKSGVSKETILQKYGISETMYRRVINRESLVMYKVKNCEFGKKKSSKKLDNTLLDATILEWIKNAKDRGDPIYRSMIVEKALLFNKQLNGPETFKASRRWIDGFQKRYNIRFKGEKQEKTSEDFANAEEFSKILRKKIESENLNLNNIYNADESGILWQLLKACTLPIYLEELKASEERGYNDRVTALFCTNVTGSHRIPPLVIGKCKNPQCLNNLLIINSQDQRLMSLKNLGVIYTYQDNALLDNGIFILWYKDEFIPRVLEHQRTYGITGKVLLLIDNNGLSHSSLDKLNAINENFQVVRLPYTGTKLIQPMDQGLVATTEKLSKKILLESLLTSDKSEEPAEKGHQISLLRQLLLSGKSEKANNFLRELNLLDYFSMLSIAWKNMSSITIQRAWKPLLDDLHYVSRHSICFPYEICNQVSELLSKPDYSTEQSKEFLIKWFATNHNIRYSWEKLSSDSDINSTTNGRCESENVTCNFESIIEIEKSEPIFEDPDSVKMTSIEDDKYESIFDSQQSEPFLENPGSVESTSTWSCETESIFENDESEPSFKNPEPVEITSKEDCELESIIKIEKSEPIFEDPEPVEISLIENGEPESISEIQKSEPFFENPGSVESTSTWSCESESLFEIEKSEPIFENPGPVQSTSTWSCESESIIEIEKSEPSFENPKPAEISTSEALKCIVKFRKWLQWRSECLPKHLDYVKALETVIMEHMPEK